MKPYNEALVKCKECIIQDDETYLNTDLAQTSGQKHWACCKVY